MTIHKNPYIKYHCIFGPIDVQSPYLWITGKSSKPLANEMKIGHLAKSEAVKRALSDFGIEESFKQAAKRFKEHYKFDISPSAVSRKTKEIAHEAMEYVSQKLSDSGLNQCERNELTDKILVELDGCEIRTAQLNIIDDCAELTPVYKNKKKTKTIKWRDVRLGFARPLQSDPKIFVGKMDSYPAVVGQLHDAAKLAGMTSGTEIIGVADGGIGLSEELKRRFPDMQFILDKSHLRDHFYETAEKIGINKENRPKWVNSRVKSISEGYTNDILLELKELYLTKPEGRLKRLIGYIERFEDALDYAAFKEAGYPIGSGEIESAHKSIPQKRLKIPGASWHPDSIDPLLALRILRADDWWEDFWNQRAERAMAA